MKNRGNNDRSISNKQIISLLKKYSNSEEAFKRVLAHSEVVKEVALELWKKAKQKGHILDRGLIIRGSLLHDIGRFFFPPSKDDSIKHGIKGGEILREEGLIQESKIAERHVGFGIRVSDVENQHLPLPKRDYMPKSKEEKIVCYADKLVSGTKRIPFEFSLRRFANEISPWIIKRGIELHNDVMELCSPDKKIEIKRSEDIFRFIEMNTIIDFINNILLNYGERFTPKKTYLIKIERRSPLFLYAGFNEKGLVRGFALLRKEKRIKVEKVFEVPESLILGTYEKSEEYLAHPERIKEILEQINKKNKAKK